MKMYCKILACLLVILQASVSAAAQDKPTEPLPIITTILGQKLDQDTLKGKIIVVDFWATWCMPCRKALPDLKKVHDKYKDNPNVVFIGMAEETAIEKVKTYVETNDIPWHVALDDKWLLAKRYKVKALPHLLVLDHKQKLAWEGSLDDLDKTLKNMLRNLD